MPNTAKLFLLALPNNEALIMVREEALPDEVWGIRGETLPDKASVGVGKKTSKY